MGQKLVEELDFKYVYLSSSMFGIFEISAR